MRIVSNFSPPLIGFVMNRSFSIGMVLLAVYVGGVIGCNGSVPGFSSGKSSQANGSEMAQEESSSKGSNHVVAEGELKPRGGVLSVMAPPGDRVARVAVSEGDSVAAGDLLVELESLRAKTIELQVAETKLAQGKARLEAETAAGEARLQVARTKLKQAETQLKQSEGKLEIAESAGGSLDLLRRAAELGERKLEQLRSASHDPSTTRLVSKNKLEEKSLKISETRAQYEIARIEANDAIEAGKLSVEAAKQEIVAAEKSMAAAEAAAALESLEKKIELLRLNIETAKLISPMAGKILAIETMPGQATSTMPLLYMADTSEMVCVAEVNVADLHRIETGQHVKIQSPGLTDDLHGKVQRIQQMIASPQMASPLPMAPVDRFTAEVTIAIDPADAQPAAQRIRMQVKVEITTTASTTSAPESDSASLDDEDTSAS